MRMMRRTGRWMSALLVVAMMVFGVHAQAHAGLVGTEAVIAAEQAMLDRAELLAALDQVEVRDRLVSLGVDPEVARERVAALSDDELRQMAEHMDQLPAGGIGSVVGALVFVFIVLLVTDILGFTDVFPFVKKTVN